MKTMAKVLGAAACMAVMGLVSASVVAQDNSRKATLEVYNEPGLSKTECLISGKRSEEPNKGGLKLLKKIVHEGSNKTTRYDVQVPAEFVGVRYQCRPVLTSDGKVPERASDLDRERARYYVEQVISRVPLTAQYAKASCGGSLCGHSMTLR